MTTTLASPEAGRAVHAHRPARSVNALGRGSGLALGVSLIWFSLLVLIPLAAVVVRATTGGWDGFWHVLTNDQTAAALRLTVGESLLVTALNIVMGTTIAWVLVRDRFP